MSATFKSNTYEGRYLKLSLTEGAVDSIANTSPVTWLLESIGGSSNYYTVSDTTVSIDNKTVYEKSKTAWSDKVFPAAKGSKTGTLTVKHNADGTKTVDVSFITSVYVGYPLEYGGTFKLTPIDRTAPTVTCAISNITSVGFKISATSNVTANLWEYSTDGGVTWTQFSTTAGTTATTTITNLKANITYSVKVRARKALNHIYGTSDASNAKTLGASVVTTAYDFAVDVDSPVVKVDATVYDASFYHRISIKNGSVELFAVDVGKWSAGSTTRSIPLTSEQRLILLKDMASVKTKSYNLLLSTYSNSGYTTRVGSEDSDRIRATTSAEISGPSFPGFTYSDVKTAVVAVTGNDQIMVQSLSSLTVVCQTGTAKNAATIKSYSATIGNASKTSTSRTLALGAISTYGDLILTVSCTDSRGYSVSKEAIVTVLPYEPPRINTYSLRRLNEVEGLVQLSFGGYRSAIMADGTTDTNEITVMQYRYKGTSEERYSEYSSILSEASISGTSFSFASLELLELDPESSYHIHLQIQDAFGTLSAVDIIEILPRGVPIISIRKRNGAYNFPRVGINNPAPAHALDVSGDIAMNGALVLGYAGELTDESFDAITSGIWYYGGAGCYNTPVDAAGFLMAFTNGSAVIQRYITLAGAEHLRAYSGSSWSAWT